MPQPYLSLEAELHDAFWETDDDSSEVPLIAEFLQQHPGTALEIGSGSGRLMFPLIQQGFSIEGLELSADMRLLGERRAQRMGITAAVHAGDMNLWTHSRPYNAILAPAFTLQLADDPAFTLRHWRSLLQAGGGLYITTFIPYAELLGELPENSWYPDHHATLNDGRKGSLETRHRIDLSRQRLTREHRYTISGDPPLTHQSIQNLRWIEHPEMLELLADAGFRLDRAFLDFDPCQPALNPSHDDFDGILTYQATLAGL